MARRNCLAIALGGWLLLTPLSRPATAQGDSPPSSPSALGQSLFTDDLDYESLVPAIERSLRHLALLARERTFTLCGKSYSAAWLSESLLTFKALLAENPGPEALQRALSRDFLLCRAGGLGGEGEMLVTGYFEPVRKASLQQEGAFAHPLYQKPLDLIPATQDPDRKGGRLDDGSFVPYFTRAEIEKKRLLAGRELVWLADPLDAFILHVQGSGWLEFADGTRRRVQFAGKNGRPYRSIGRLLVEQGALSREEATMPAILEYLSKHPAKREAILHHNESFVFFRWGDETAPGPLGSLGQPLTPGRSIALDQAQFPPGALAWLSSSQPELGETGEVKSWRPLARFVLNQDSGSAITGPGRLDLFFGAGPEAEIAAGNMRQPGLLYFLVKKQTDNGKSHATDGN